MHLISWVLHETREAVHPIRKAVPARAKAMQLAAFLPLLGSGAMPRVSPAMHAVDLPVQTVAKMLVAAADAVLGINRASPQGSWNEQARYATAGATATSMFSRALAASASA